VESVQERTSTSEAARLECLRQYQILDTPPEAEFEDLARLAAHICRTPFALISFVDEHREWVKASVGWHVGEIAHNASFAWYASRHYRSGQNGSQTLFLVPNAKDDARFTENPFVCGEPHLCFIAAVPIVTGDGGVLGWFLVLDTERRLLDDKQVSALHLLARQVMALLDLRRQVLELNDLTVVRSRAEETARWQARHDLLTGLPNRTMFMERVEETLAVNRVRHGKDRQEGEKGQRPRAASRSSAALLFVDLDRFKRINDTLGHAAGDVLLREVAARFAGCLRTEDTLARLGGDEFTVLLADIPNSHYAATVAQMLLRTLRRPVTLGAQDFHIGASIGIALYPRDGGDAQTLLKHADIAMYQAKEHGGYQVYSRRMNAKGFQQLVDEGELRRAIEQDELFLCYQPQVNLATGEILGVEALARWRHPHRGAIPPSHFIPLAEQADLIGVLGEWVLRRACRDAAAWRLDGYPDLRVAVNLSARQLAQTTLVESVTEILREHGLPGGALDLELTETALCANGDSTPQTLRALRALGIRLFVDDFGTGYSSLAYLRRFRVDALKIDHSFVAGLGKGTPDEALIHALVEMAHALDLQVIAEGVETEYQRDILRTLGCDHMQGYLYGRPMPLNDLRSFLAERRADRHNVVNASALFRREASVAVVPPGPRSQHNDG
jgi:diguanylate cyclase (GGDEF)-like protein